eukprot:703046-Rhodomonas_salina.3
MVLLVVPAVKDDAVQQVQRLVPVFLVPPHPSSVPSRALGQYRTWHRALGGTLGRYRTWRRELVPARY